MNVVNRGFTRVISGKMMIRRVAISITVAAVLGVGVMGLIQMMGQGSAMGGVANEMMAGVTDEMATGVEPNVVVEMAEPSGMAITKPNGEVKTVLVRLQNADFIASVDVMGAARAEIDEANVELRPSLDDLPGYHRLIREMENFPIAIYEVDAEGEASLRTSPLVRSVTENKLMKTMAPLEGMVSPIEAALDGSYADGFTDGMDYYDGTGQKVVVIDSGVNKNHVAMAGRVVAEACFSLSGPIADGMGSNLCDGSEGVLVDETHSIFGIEGEDTALPCDASYVSCDHGTAVAAAAVMAPMSLAPEVDGLPAGTTFDTRGVASGAGLVAIKAGALYEDAGGKKFMPDLNSTMLALDYAYEMAVTDETIAAINISSVISEYAGTAAECQNIELYDDFNNLFGQFKSIGVAVFVAAGNDGDGENQGKIAAFSCVENAVAVAAAKNDGSALAYYSNNGELTDLLAPGGDASALVGGAEVEDLDDVLWMPTAFDNNMVNYGQGTSLAAPMAAGAYAVLREKNPEVGVDQLVKVMQDTGRKVTDVRSGYAAVGAKSLIQLDAALAAEVGEVIPNPDPGEPIVPEVPNTDGPVAVPQTGLIRADDGSEAQGFVVVGVALVMGAGVVVGGVWFVRRLSAWRRFRR